MFKEDIKKIFTKITPNNNSSCYCIGDCVKFEGIKRIISVEEKSVELSAFDKKILIKGSELIIEELSGDSVLIKGKVDSLEFTK